MSKGKELKHSPKCQSYSNPPMSPSSNPSKNPSTKTFFPFESQEPKDFSCLVIQSIKSKTQVNSPKFISLLNNSSFSSDSHPDLRSFEFELYQKCSDEKIKKKLLPRRKSKTTRKRRKKSPAWLSKGQNHEDK